MRRLDRRGRVIETTDLEVSDATSRIKEHREPRVMLDNDETIATFAQEISEFLKTSELTATRSFVKEVEVKPGNAVSSTVSPRRTIAP